MSEIHRATEAARALVLAANAIRSAEPGAIQHLKANIRAWTEAIVQAEEVLFLARRQPIRLPGLNGATAHELAIDYAAKVFNAAWKTLQTNEEPCTDERLLEWAKVFQRRLRRELLPRSEALLRAIEEEAAAAGRAAAEPARARAAMPAAEPSPSLDARALALYLEDPTRKKKDLARLLGLKNVQSLSPARCPRLAAAMRAERRWTVRGTKRDGALEAWDES